MRVFATLALGIAIATCGSPAFGATPPPDDPSLQQTIEADRPIAEDQAVLSIGHIDLGPRFTDGEWELFINDDAARSDPSAVSVWRRPANTVLQVVDAAQLAAPDDPAYAFLGVEPGAPLWVIPQSQNPDAVWLGWNTQDPGAMNLVDRGVTLSLDGVQGPGDLVVFVQSGSFDPPQVLWDSRTASEPIWVDVNTHTHATWVFTEPGVHLVRVQVSAQLVDGSEVSDTQDLRFAIGSATSTDDAADATWQGPEPTPTPTTAVSVTAKRSSLPLIVGGSVVLLVGIGLAIVAVRASRARRAGLADQ